MKRRNKFILIAAILIIAIASYYIWFFNSSPYLDASKISSITQYRYPSPPEIITISDEATIQQFVEYFNKLEFIPIIYIQIGFSGGWYARDDIEFKNSVMYEISGINKYDDNYMLVSVKRRLYYKVNLTSYYNLLDIISNTRNDQ
ncbi:MAG: hypothetical protein FWC47_06340 [Oscillospiraceae bacterium]|nr:hypothetical protein [Oscillospiraceae bacterium]